MSHSCHIPPCRTACPPSYLFCRQHWAMVPRDLQRAVYRTVGLRGPSVDETWAPWWRAQAAATVFVLRKAYPDYESRIDRIEQREKAFADKLEGKGKPDQSGEGG